jgi:hypothetical protein
MLVILRRTKRAPKPSQKKQLAEENLQTKGKAKDIKGKQVRRSGK